MFLPTFFDQSVEHLLAWRVTLSHTNVNLLPTKMSYWKSVRQNYISNIILFDKMTLVLFNRFSVKIFQQIDMCDRFTPWFANWPNWACKSVEQIQLTVEAVLYSYTAIRTSDMTAKEQVCWNQSQLVATLWLPQPWSPLTVQIVCAAPLLTSRGIKRC